jgi:protein ImuA
MATSLPPNRQCPLDTARRAETVAALAEQLRELEGGRFSAGGGEIISTGVTALDRLLPGGGLRRGTLVEWLGGTADGAVEKSFAGAAAASGAGTLALVAAHSAMQAGGALVVFDRRKRFYPPAAIAWNIPLERLIVVRPSNAADEAWAVDQSLRSHGVAAVWLPLETADEHTLRRWQLAAESSGAMGLLMRGAEARSEPSWAELRLGIQPLSQATADRTRRLQVKLLRTRSGHADKTVEVELPAREVEQESWGWRGASHEAGALHLVFSMAAATHRHSRRA